MADPLTLLESLKPDFKSTVYGAIGLLASLIWSAIRARRVSVAWTAVFQAIRPVGAAPVSSKVSVLVNDQPALNLHSCQITVVNESSRDIENIDLLFTFYAPFSIVEGTGGLADSGKALLLSDGFQKTVAGVLATPEATRTTTPQYEYVVRNREFHLAALNRGETASFMFWVNSPAATDNPIVVVTTEKVGVKMISRPAKFRPLNVTAVKVALLIGVPIALLWACGVSLTGLPPLTMSFVAMLGGLLSGAFGFGIAALIRWVRRVI
ncbi:MAG TPA: hypothetical protein VG734_02390 [Lacunisphaera sp.]|nr:hypothetical protein [Lacunisphaera sp.]